METFELKYFLGVAREENLHRASEKLRVSPASLSKAVSRLEEELSVSLFTREGRQIRLTDHGRLLQKRAAEIVQLEEATRLELAGHQGGIQAVLTGPEVLLASYGVALVCELRERFPRISFELFPTTDEQALERLGRGEAHLALVTSELPSSFLKEGMVRKVRGEACFQTVVGKRHPLYRNAQAGREVPVEEVLKHSFASPDHPLLGKVGLRQSADGWRDDQFPRRVDFRTSSLKLLEELVVGGHALAYLPDYHVRRLDVKPLKITGCPYKCLQKVSLVAKNPGQRGWLNQWF